MPSLPRTDGDDVCSTMRDTPWFAVAFYAAKLMGTRLAKTILCRRRQPRDRRYGCKANGSIQSLLQDRGPSRYANSWIVRLTAMRTSRNDVVSEKSVREDFAEDEA